MFCLGLSGFCFQKLKEATSSPSTRKAIFLKINNQLIWHSSEMYQECVMVPYSLFLLPGTILIFIYKVLQGKKHSSNSVTSSYYFSQRMAWSQLMLFTQNVAQYSCSSHFIINQNNNNLRYSLHSKMQNWWVKM